MSEHASQAPADWTARLPASLRPRADEPATGGRRRLVETTLLVLAGLALAIATVNDVVLQTHVNHRLIADLRTWRQFTGHDYHNVTISQDLTGHSTRDVTCGNTAPGGLKERVQLCLVMTGPVTRGVRAARSGWYTPPRVEDLRQYRYGCFGLARTEGECPR